MAAAVLGLWLLLAGAVTLRTIASGAAIAAAATVWGLMVDG